VKTLGLNRPLVRKEKREVGENRKLSGERGGGGKGKGPPALEKKANLVQGRFYSTE